MISRNVPFVTASPIVDRQITLPGCDVRGKGVALICGSPADDFFPKRIVPSREDFWFAFVIEYVRFGVVTLLPRRIDDAIARGERPLTFAEACRSQSELDDLSFRFWVGRNQAITIFLRNVREDASPSGEIVIYGDERAEVPTVRPRKLEGGGEK